MGAAAVYVACEPDATTKCTHAQSVVMEGGGRGTEKKHTCALVGSLSRPSAQSGEKKKATMCSHGTQRKEGPSASRQSPSLVKGATQILAQNTQQRNAADGHLSPNLCLNFLCNISIHEDTALGVNRCASEQHFM